MTVMSYLEAGKQYDRLADNDAEQAIKSEDRLYSAVIAYYQAIKNKDQLNYYQLAWAREGLRVQQHVLQFELFELGPTGLHGFAVPAHGLQELSCHGFLVQFQVAVDIADHLFGSLRHQRMGTFEVL